MSRRRIHPTKILAVALTASGAVGCAAAPAAPETPPAVAVTTEEEPGAPAVADSTPAPEAPAGAADSTPATPNPSNELAAMVEEPAEAAPALTKDQLETLRTELDEAGRDGAKAKTEHFRPLCDADGYPLVGNLVRKGASDDSYQVSDFCTDVREP